MGSTKGLLPWGPKTVLGHLLGQIRAAGLENVVLITGAHHEAIQASMASEQVRIHFNEDWETGMGSSLASGLRYTRQYLPGIGAILVLLSDQPLVSADFLRELLREYHAAPQRIIASKYRVGAGVPAVFPSSFWPELEELPPDKGARLFIEAHREEAVAIEPGLATTDIDTPSAYRKALELAGINLK